MAELVVVTPGTAASVLSGLPPSLRLVFRLAAGLERGTLDATMPDGRRFRFGTGSEPHAAILIRDPRFARRLMVGGDLGMAASYLRGDWDTPDLTALLHLFALNYDLGTAIAGGHRAVVLWQRLAHWLRRNTRRQAKRNIHAHYDLGNRFYAAWLDRTMTYSSALYEDDADLPAAQTEKYRRLAEDLHLAPGQTVLEIGCGWGGFAEFAAKEYGVRLTGLTISREQHDFARRRMFEAGLSERVDIALRDYRDETGLYDRIASIEMIEAVGEQYWPDYFRQLGERVRQGGAVGIQAITIQDHLFPAYRRSVDFIRGYVFPGGMLPSPGTLAMLAGSAGLSTVGERIFGDHYARTLAEWRLRFRAAWPDLQAMGFDERFRRLWEYYLAYSEAGFRSGNIDVRQIVFARV